jgi:HSP20 family protein
MNTLKLFTPAVYRTLPVDLFDHFLNNSLNETNSFYPYINILEENDKFQIELALPGYSKEQISMNYLKNVLTIKSNIEENTSEEKKFLTREFGQRGFSKQFVIPQMLDAEKITAEFTDGVLRVNVPKKEEAKVKEPIEVQIQ